MLFRSWLAAQPTGQGVPLEQAMAVLSQQVDRQAALLAYGDVFRTVALVFLLASPLVLLLGRPARDLAAGRRP